MDLSHWDAIRKLTHGEAAALMAGSEPHINRYCEAHDAKRAVMSRLIEEAVDAAYTAAWVIVLDITERPSATDLNAFDFSNNELPSIELRKIVADFLAVHGSFDVAKTDPLINGQQCKQSFHREDVRDWINAMSIKSIYSFDGFGNDRLPDVPYEPRVDPASSPSESRKSAEPPKASPAPRRSADTTVKKKLLSIIAALADQAHIDLAQRGTAKRIEEWTQHMGCPVSEDTIKTYLDMIPEVLDQQHARNAKKSEFGKAKPN